MPGISTLAVEVTHVSRHCFWLLLVDEELAIPCSDFPSDLENPGVMQLARFICIE